MNILKPTILISITAFLCSFLASCKQDEDDINTQTSITYTITMSPDLLKCVTPQVIYVDENGNLVKITGVEELDGKIIENSAEIEKGGGTISSWTKQEITGTGYKCWTVQMKFNRLNFHTYMAVRYIKNDLHEDYGNKYFDFHHSINTSINSITTSDWGTNAFSDTDISITVGDFHVGDDINTYINQLEENPDRIGYYIDSKGKVERKDDFIIQ